MRRLIQLSLLLPLLALSLSCGGGASDLDDNEAAVFLTVSDIDYGGGAFVSVCAGMDAFVASLTINSNFKDPEGMSSPGQDVVLTRWQVTPYRTDGGTVASPVWIRDLSITVPAGGSTTLDNFNYYSAVFYNDPPLSYLFPENGGFDPETGNRTIEQSMTVKWFGRTMSGKNITVEYVLYFQFACEWGQ